MELNPKVIESKYHGNLRGPDPKEVAGLINGLIWGFLVFDNIYTRWAPTSCKWNCNL